MTLTNKEYELLELLYFTHTFDALQKESCLAANDLESELVSLLNKGWVHQMYFDEACKDYVMNDPPDLLRIKESAYVISKEGLLRHNSI